MFLLFSNCVNLGVRQVFFFDVCDCRPSSGIGQDRWFAVGES